MTTADTPPNPPAGWYPDPTDASRQVFWDGTQWTGQAQSATFTGSQGGWQPIPPYGGYVQQPQAVYPVQSKTNGLAVASLVLGLIPVIPFIGSILAMVFSGIARRSINRSGGRETGKGMAIAGGILGLLTMIGTFILGSAYLHSLHNTVSTDYNNTGGYSAPPSASGDLGGSGDLGSGGSSPDSGGSPVTPSSAAPSSAPATSPITVPTPTTVACPTGSPQANVSLSATPDSTITGYWDVTLTGTVVDGFNAPVEVLSVSAQVVATGGSPQSEFLFPNGLGIPTLNPGQSASVSSSSYITIESTGQPTLGTITDSWVWPVGSPYETCSTGVG